MLQPGARHCLTVKPLGTDPKGEHNRWVSLSRFLFTGRNTRSLPDERRTRLPHRRRKALPLYTHRHRLYAHRHRVCVYSAECCKQKFVPPPSRRFTPLLQGSAHARRASVGYRQHRKQRRVLVLVTGLYLKQQQAGSHTHHGKPQHREHKRVRHNRPNRVAATAMHRHRLRQTNAPSEPPRGIWLFENTFL